MKRVITTCLLALLLCVASLGATQTTHAASSTAPTKGLRITPVRQFLSADAGKTVDSTFTVTNLTDGTLDIQLTVQQFSVSDYIYDYNFSPPTHDWLHLSTRSVTLQPHQDREIAYSVVVPSGGKPSGYYYTLFANATVTTQGVKSTIQAADLLYLTVNGNLTRTSRLQGSHMPWISFGRSIPYSLQPIDTGNIHFFIYTSGQLHGWLIGPGATPETHLLMPGKPRTIYGNIKAPILPGIYRATYGYKTESGETVMQSRWLVFIPPWFIALFLGALLLAGKFLPYKKNRKQSAGQSAKPADPNS